METSCKISYISFQLNCKSGNTRGSCMCEEQAENGKRFTEYFEKWSALDKI